MTDLLNGFADELIKIGEKKKPSYPSGVIRAPKGAPTVYQYNQKREARERLKAFVRKNKAKLGPPSAPTAAQHSAQKKKRLVAGVRR